jgi:hypothetical protein
MLVTVLILAPIAALLGALSLAARRDRQAGRVLEPRRIATIEPVSVVVLPDPDELDERGAFAYDNGLIMEDS